MSGFLMQKVLGADWHKLPRVIQRHYEVGENQGSCLEGAMTIAYPAYMLPLIRLIHGLGGLVFRRGADIDTRVQKTASGGLLYWHRTMTYSDGKSDCFRSQMAYCAEHQLIETIRFGFGLRLTVAVSDGDLIYRSNGHFWQCGRCRLIIPDGLLLGSATISEHALSEHEFYLDFTIRHPLWGITYYYRGKFRSI